jgi:hypothetical protein
MTAKKQPSTQLAPDKAPLTKSQATMLSSLTGIETSKFTGLSVTEISSEYHWQIDPNFFLFVRVCGQVVKYNPATGTQDPVPYATVYAEDTDCWLLGLFPEVLPWGWFFPFRCETEVIAQTTTDACGNFCVWIPRFEIEWILRFRLERICYLELFTKPTVGSILGYLQGNPIGPDPAPDTQVSLKPGTALYSKAEQLLGTQVARQLAAQGANKIFGSATTGQKTLLARPAFPTPLPPALPKEFRRPAKLSHEKHLSAVKSTLANKLGIDVNQIEGLNLNRYYGPFLRCFDILIPEWVPIFEVPDISFRVTQDVNGSGTQQVIYSGGLFDIPWNVGGISNVTLVASAIAVSVANCNSPNVPCGDVPSLEYVGLMPLVNPPLPTAPYIDPVAGYATRPNPPHPGGTLAEPGVPPSTAPYTGTLQLYGCTQVDNASFYRLRYTYTAPGSGTPTALNPFLGLTWPLYREVAGVLQEQWPAADSNGWYPIIPTADGWFPNSLVLEWDTINSAYNANGLYTIQLEVADSAKNLLATSAAVGFVVDNSAPQVTMLDAIWSFNSDMSGGQSINTNDCAVINRGVVPQDVYIQVTYSVTANHLKYVQLDSGGCDGGATLYPPTASLTPAQAAAQLATVEHWYEDAGDNTLTNVVATYVVPASQPPGVYSFDVYAASRAFNPAGSDSGPLDDWNYNPTYIWVDPSYAFAIVNA